MTALTVIMSTEKTETKILKNMHERLIKTFMDIIIMTQLQKGPLSGYDIIAYIHTRFNLLVSSGTIYSLLYALERKDLIEGIWDERKRTYKLTEKGQKQIQTILNAHEKINNLITNILKNQPQT